MGQQPIALSKSIGGKLLQQAVRAAAVLVQET